MAFHSLFKEGNSLEVAATGQLFKVIYYDGDIDFAAVGTLPVNHLPGHSGKVLCGIVDEEGYVKRVWFKGSFLKASPNITTNLM